MRLDAPLTAINLSREDHANRDPLELLTVDDVAALLKVSRSWVYEHTRSRGAPGADRLPHLKIGKYVRFDPRLIRQFIERRSARS